MEETENFEPRRWWQPDHQALRDRWLTIRAVYAASRPMSIAVIGCILVGAALPVAFTIATGVAVGAVGPALRDGLGSPAGSHLTRAVALVGALFVVQQTLEPVRDGIVDLLGRYFRRDMFRRTMSSMLAPATISHLEDPAFKDRVAKVNQIGQLGPRAAVQGLAGQTTRRLGALGSFVLVVRVTPLIGLLLLAVLLHEQRRYRNAHESLTALVWNETQQLRRSNYLLSLATGPDAAKEVRVFALPSWLIQRYRDAWLAAMQKLWGSRRGGWPSALKGSLPVVAVEVIAFATIGRRAATGSLGIGEMVVYASALIGSANLSGVTDHDAYVAEGVRVVRSIFELEEAIETASSLQMTGERSSDGLPAASIRFENVTFRYPGQPDDVFSKLDLEIPAGKSLAIVGLNGAGKTTLVKLLARLHDPSEGRITVDGLDLRELDARGWQRRVAAIFQDFIRYPLSAAANVGFGAVERQHDPAALEAAASAADILDVIEGLPAGWDTVLNRQFEGGADLSGGQWQRVALARALLAAQSGAGVLVLDEPTAQLDVRAEAAFYERFLEITAGLTTLVISHRFSTVRRADRIVVLEHGSIVEQGTHAELLGLAGRYAEMFRLQADRFTDA